jgi:hypothetical protein
MVGGYNRYHELVQPAHTMQTISQDISTNAFDSLPWDETFVISTIAPSEPTQAPMVQPYSIFQAAVIPHQHSNLPINGFQAQGGGEMACFPISPASQTLQMLDSPSEPVSAARSPLSEPSSSRAQLALPPRGARKQIRRDPTPNEQGQYLCTYEGCMKKDRTFRLPCHWQ